MTALMCNVTLQTTEGAAEGILSYLERVIGDLEQRVLKP